MTLDQLHIDRTATIRGTKNHELSVKLVEMGICEGQTVRVLFKAPFGDPIAVHVAGYTLSLRKQEAALIDVI